MRVSQRASAAFAAAPAIAFAGFLLAGTGTVRAQQPAATDNTAQAGNSASIPASACEPALLGSPYIPVDSWVYPAVLRLYSLGYVDSVFLGLRPWTRTSVVHMLEEAGDLIDDGESAGDPGAAEAREI